MVSDPYSFILFLSFKKMSYSHTAANDQINPDKPVIPCWYWAKPVKFEALLAVMKYFRWLKAIGFHFSPYAKQMSSLSVYSQQTHLLSNVCILYAPSWQFCYH